MTTAAKIYLIQTLMSYKTPSTTSQITDLCQFQKRTVLTHKQGQILTKAHQITTKLFSATTSIRIDPRQQENFS